jgi:putative hydrolase of the HAD superfamily
VAAIELIGFDGDDTLWHNETIFSITQERFEALLEEHAPADVVHARTLDTERRNLALYGYGIKSFTLSMIETAIEITDGTVDAADIKTLLDLGKSMLRHPTELLEGARQAIVDAAAHGYRVVLITKGDLFDQESKLARSGLGELFESVEVVSEKDERTYARVLARHDVDPASFVMVGNSLKSDIVPVVELGGRAVHVPYHVTWALEEADPPAEDAERWARIDRLDALPSVLRSWAG